MVLAKLYKFFYRPRIKRISRKRKIAALIPFFTIGAGLGSLGCYLSGETEYAIKLLVPTTLSALIWIAAKYDLDIIPSRRYSYLLV
jgi:hypothetical protein